jgi:hypothetical protein
MTRQRIDTAPVWRLAASKKSHGSTFHFKLDQNGVPGVLVKGRTLGANGIRTLAVESVQP